MEVSGQYEQWYSYGVHVELRQEPRAEVPIMSDILAGVMTTSPELIYTRHVTLTWCPVCLAWTACTRRRGRAGRRTTAKQNTHKDGNLRAVLTKSCTRFTA